MERDRLVFTEVRKKRGKPIFMVTSGGYQVGSLAAFIPSLFIIIILTMEAMKWVDSFLYNIQGSQSAT